MRHPFVLPIILLVVIMASACKKNSSTVDCFPATPTIREITDQQATVKFSGTQFYIVEKGAIDTKLVPCNLLLEFQTDNLPVTVSGKVKASSNGSGPCCSQDFVITRISK